MTDNRRATRQIFGSGSLAIDPEMSVFINCPFDSDFEILFDAIIFSTVCCGFMPRSAMESGNVSDSRMERITQAMYTSKYSIHDLSRCRGEGMDGFARFNMPLELGIAMARRYNPNETVCSHDWLLLVTEGHQYTRYISDLAGYDPKTHNGTIETIVPKIMAWLLSRPGASSSIKPNKVLADFPKFQAEKSRLSEEWVGEIPWADIVLAARNSVPSL